MGFDKYKAKAEEKIKCCQFIYNAHCVQCTFRDLKYTIYLMWSDFEIYSLSRKNLTFLTVTHLVKGEKHGKLYHTWIGSKEEPIDPPVIYRTVTRKDISRLSHSGIIVKLCFTWAMHQYLWVKKNYVLFFPSRSLWFNIIDS